jgi:peptidoglycan/xylan/chitin deacetylase (PgdA/CDA1 family)
MKELFSEIPILTYHKITSRREFGINTVAPDKFREQIEFLQHNNFTPITFQELLQGIRPSKPVIITFDDGYASVFEHAFPVLREFQFKAVIFLITEFLGRENSWDVNLGGIRFAHLDQQQVAELSLAGHELGSHGATHRALNFLHRKEIESELNLSREVIQEISNQPVTTLAYPFGMQNKNIQQQAREAGYQVGCINLWGKSAPNNRLSLRRIPVYGIDSLTSFKRKLSGGFLNTLELAKLRLLSCSAFLTPLFQKQFSNLY